MKKLKIFPKMFIQIFSVLGIIIILVHLTAFSDEEYKIDAFTNLVDGYVEKPFSLPVLKARIDSLIKKFGVLFQE
ncbi:hypothetical protein EfmAA818_30320 (plasmid) [Enterococcus faecium]|nr:hypothetical protein EfmAA818_30320 [Enterococcus faecium]